MHDEYDVAIIGGGPAGFTAGIYAGRSGMKAVILDRAMAGGQMATAYLIENWPGDQVVSGSDLTARMRAHSEQYVQIREFTEISSIRSEGAFVIETSEGTIRAKAILLATGAEHRKMGVPGESEFNG